MGGERGERGEFPWVSGEPEFLVCIRVGSLYARDLDLLYLLLKLRQQMEGWA